jgi:hypothetical protein
MPKVNCPWISCIYNDDELCRAERITLQVEEQALGILSCGTFETVTGKGGEDGEQT